MTLIKNLALHLLLFCLGFTVTFAVLAWPRWEEAEAEAVTMIEAHESYSVAHPGWSFPARVWSDSAEIEGMPTVRRLVHAQARGYAVACPSEEPGTICDKTGEVVLRGGRFPEGTEPPGNEGWSRPLAFEPLLIGILSGEDAEVRWHLPLEEAPKLLTAAIIAAEDGEFYEHSGVNLRGVLRAAVANMRGGGAQQGASTLTMQVVRNLSQDKDRTFKRKLREMLRSVAVDRYLGKDGVLQAYLDAPYLGQLGSMSICGFQAAAWHYYGVEAADLSLGQAATLAGILPAPGRFAPDRHPEEARRRRDYVLDRLAERGWDVAEAKAEPIESAPHPLPVDSYPAYLQATRIWLEANLPPETVTGAGLEVYTALDIFAQEASEKLVPDRVKGLERAVGRRGTEPMQAAGAILDPSTGLLVAAYGGDQILSTDFNRATQAKRQAGSSMKPLVYALGFSLLGEDGKPRFTASHTVPNSPRTFPNTNGWRPRNIGGEYTPTASLAQGIIWSQNIATASLLEEAGGPEPFIALAKKLGYDTTAWPHEMGLALGQAEVSPLEMARFVATVIDEGHLASGRPVKSAVDPSGTARVPPPERGAAVLTPETAAITRDLMRSVIEQGTGGATRGGGGYPGFGGPAIGKTGTTDKEKDLWFVGGTPHYALAMWMGYDQPTPTGAAASDLAAPLWGWWMRAISEGLALDDFGGMKLQHRAICSETGKYSNGTCKLVGAPFLEGTHPDGTCPIQHPPPDPEKKKYESLWKRKAREAEEAAAAVAGEQGEEEEEIEIE